MKKVFGSLFISTILCIGCDEVPHQRESKVLNGVVVYEKPLWSKRLSSSGWIYGSVNTSALDNKSVLITGRRGSAEFLGLISPRSGRLRWSLPSTIIDEPYYTIPSAHVYNNSIIYQLPSKTISINYRKGKLNYIKYHQGLYNTRISGIESLFFISGQSNKDMRYGSVYVGNTETGDIRELVKPTFHSDTIMHNPDIGMLGEVWDVHPFIGECEDTLLLVNYERFNPNNRSTGFVGLYNYSDGRWLWDSVMVSPSSHFSRLQGSPVISEGFAFQLNQGISCINLTTGGVVWQVIDSVTYTGSGIVLHNGLLITVNELGHVLAFAIRSGDLLWTSERLGALPSNLQIDKDVLYYVSGSTHTLYAVDLTCGRTLWSIASPDLEFDRGAFFRAECHLYHGGKQHNYLLIPTFRGIHCYLTFE